MAIGGDTRGYSAATPRPAAVTAAVMTREHREEVTGRERSGERTGNSRQPTRVRAERDVNRADHTNVKDEQ